jgi:aspartyl-tRNA(Asn)/glutamyl-tRNA(Gln) amidotransferase subunit C
MSISRQDIEKVALLARLQLSEAELNTMTDQLAQIVGYVDQLAEVNTGGVEPMAHAIELKNIFAQDEVKPSLPREEALANAPHHDERGYLVPAVLGEYES